MNLATSRTGGQVGLQIGWQAISQSSRCPALFESGHALECALVSGQRLGDRFDHLPGVLLLELGWAAVSERKVQPGFRPQIGVLESD
jgi:hypothetical protein